ncbi:hypothetical protein VM57_15335 [Stenotrophomonas maltophilia]|uniref:Uncharacterized protein n=1 Tax=Stenotrophomonas maltophilia TaxID=40324 RepID=A0A0F5ZMR9_STEMA|nr:hypothetical protein VM57_15335 [Stenotrophomonas maltophilia]
MPTCWTEKNCPSFQSIALPVLARIVIVIGLGELARISVLCMSPAKVVLPVTLTMRGATV